jgi:hypothetical protein
LWNRLAIALENRTKSTQPSTVRACNQPDPTAARVRNSRTWSRPTRTDAVDSLVSRLCGEAANTAISWSVRTSQHSAGLPSAWISDATENRMRCDEAPTASKRRWASAGTRVAYVTS